MDNIIVKGVYGPDYFQLIFFCSFCRDEGKSVSFVATKDKESVSNTRCIAVGDYDVYEDAVETSSLPFVSWILLWKSLEFVKISMLL